MQWSRLYQRGIDYRTGKPFTGPGDRIDVCANIASARTHLDARAWAYRLHHGSDPIREPLSPSLDALFARASIPTAQRRRWNIGEAREFAHGARPVAVHLKRGGTVLHRIAVSPAPRAVAIGGERGPAACR